MKRIRTETQFEIKYIAEEKSFWKKYNIFHDRIAFQSESILRPLSDFYYV